MQFVRHGPDIPERLVQAHEDGRVVFFCGAGISYPAQLPGFDGLVEQVHASVGEPPNVFERASIRAQRFDTAIGLLEARLAGGREAVRRAVARILTPAALTPAATATQEALLTLARNRNGRSRLVTTNFDRLFEEVITSRGLTLERYRAPLLPAPKNRWDGLVYLHGLLSATPTASELDCLVLSSGDFGLAYLIERWAARFVSELFRNYTVCFVGYSINDPVLRYMMDALAADRLLGESPPEMFAFGSFSSGKETSRADEWQAKNVTPVLYREHNHHAYLHRTLQAWAANYRDGVKAKEQIVAQYAPAQPQHSAKQDDFVGQMLWALSDSSGLPARRFADLNPVPSLDWLEPFADRRFGHDDLSRFGVPPPLKRDSALQYSLVARPTPYTHAPWMVLVGGADSTARFDQVMLELARWLTRYLDEPKLVIWLTKHGGRLNDHFLRLLEGQLEHIADLQRRGQRDELERLRQYAPRAIPRPAMRTLWRLLLTGRIRIGGDSLELFQWLDRVRRDGVTPTLRMDLREMLTPRVRLREPFRMTEGEQEEEEQDHVRSLVDWELVLSTDHVHSTLLRERPGTVDWQAALPDLLGDFTTLLRDALDLMAELGSASDRSDLSYMHQPSISAHPQNRDFHDWTALIELTRDAWLAAVTDQPSRARAAVDSWRLAPYPLFRRLVFFAAASGQIVPDAEALDWLLTDDAWWLWSVETEREALRLLTALASRLEPGELAQLERAILAGPPRAMFKDDIAPERWAAIVDREVWLRLTKLREAAGALGEQAQARLDDLTTQHPDWRLQPEERDEFPVWTGDGEDWRTFTPTPRRRSELLDWLRANPDEDHWKSDDWKDRCRKHFATTAWALSRLANQDVWPVGRWREALQAWAEDELQKRSWRYIAPAIVRGPDPVLRALGHSLGWWLQKVAKTFDEHTQLFLQLSERLLSLDHDDGIEADEPVMRAINHPVGHVTQALLDWWFRRELKDNQGIPAELNPIFTRMCNTELAPLRHARVLLAAHVITLFRVDREWTARRLLPLFDWKADPQEARGAWEGFLWSPRLYRPLLAAIKPAMLETAGHFADIGEHGSQYASFLTYAALDPGDTFTTAELRDAFRSLPRDGLRDAANALAGAMESAGEQREAYWDNRIAPFWRNIWPKARELASPSIANDLFRLCIATGPRLPAALEAVRPWLQPVPHPDFLVHRLQESGLCPLFPHETLSILDALIDDQRWPPRDLGKCLEAIRGSASMLVDDPRYVRLHDYWRRTGAA